MRQVGTLLDEQYCKPGVQLQHVGGVGDEKLLIHAPFEPYISHSITKPAKHQPTAARSSVNPPSHATGNIESTEPIQSSSATV